MNDRNLHFMTLKLVAAERESKATILHHLNEIEKRKLFSDHKCSSLFDYCVRILGYSEPSAQRRIVAARLLQEIPEVDQKISNGQLTLTNISQANQFFRANEVKTTEAKKDLLGKIEGLSKKDCEKKLFEISRKKKKPDEKEERISQGECLVSIILSDDTLGEIEKVKSLIGKKLSMDEIIKFMAKAAIQKIEKEKFKKTDRPRSVSLEKEGRIPSSAIKREVYQRDGACSKCGGKWNLNFDHHLPYALGGKTNLTNLRLLCANCNQRERIKVFGTKIPKLEKTGVPPPLK